MEYSKGIALILATLFGPLGIDKFYVGATGLGVAQLIASILVIGLPYAFISILTLSLSILFGMNTFLYPEVKWSTEDPTFDKGVAIVMIVFIVLIISISVLSFFIKKTQSDEEPVDSASSASPASPASTAPASPASAAGGVGGVGGGTATVHRKTAKEKTIDTITSELFNKQTNVQFNDISDGIDIKKNVIICKNNIRNENYKNLFWFLTDIYSDLKSYESIEFKFKLETDDIIYRTNETVRDFIISEMKKIQILIDELEIKFQGNVNYLHLFFIFKDYFKFISDVIEINPNKINSLNKDTIHKIILAKIMFPLYPTLLNDALSLNWNEDFLKYTDNAFDFDQTKTVSFYTTNLIQNNLNLNNRSMEKVIEEQYAIIYPSYYNKSDKQFFVDTLKFTDEFKATFNGSNTNCKTKFDDRYESEYLQNLKYKEFINIEY